MSQPSDTPRTDELLTGREHGNAIEFLACDLERELTVAERERDAAREDARRLEAALKRYTESERWILENAEWRFVDDPKANWFSPHELAEQALTPRTNHYV